MAPSHSLFDWVKNSSASPHTKKSWEQIYSTMDVQLKHFMIADSVQMFNSKHEAIILTYISHLVSHQLLP